MICPKCESAKTQHIDHEKKAFLCVECNYAWKKENGPNEPSGTLAFNGVPEAQKIFQILTQGQKFTPEFQAALESQITAILFDQWFSGMKVGQIASILYAVEHYGKDRNEPTRTNRLREERTSSPNKVGENRRIRRGQDTANPRAAEASPTITERINGITLTYPRAIKVPDNMYASIAEMVLDLPAFIKNDFMWDGHKLTATIEW